MSLLIKNTTLVTIDPGRRILRGDLLIDGGKILRAGTISGRDMLGLGRLDVIDGSGLWTLPGFVQAHVHLCQTLFRNQAEDLPLLEWLQKRIWPLEAAHDEASLETSARLAIAELFAGGTTAVLDMGTTRLTDVLFETARQSGLRYTGGKAMMDDPTSPAGLRELTEDSLRESDRLAGAWEGKEQGLLRYAYAPRFALSCTDRLLREVGERAAGGARVHTHASESRAECDIVKRSRGADNIRYLKQTGIAAGRTVVAHAVWPAEGELDILRETDTAVAHCPSSNLKLGSGIAPVPDMLQRGIRVGLGADGAPCNNRLDVMEEMRLAALLPRPRLGTEALAALQVVEMATIGGAAALGLEGEIGSIEVGKKADLVMIDPRGLHAAPAAAEPYTAIVHCLRASDVRFTIVAGRVVFKKGELVGVDVERLRAHAASEWHRVRERAGL